MPPIEEQIVDEKVEGLSPDSVSTEEEKAQAKSLGWADGPSWRGDDGRPWKTAREFLKDSRQDRLAADLAAERRERQRLESEVRAQAASLQAIREAQEEDIAANAQARRAELESELEAAIEASDAKRQLEINKQLREIDRAEIEAEVKKGLKPAKAAETAGELDPSMVEFMRDNPWYVADRSEIGQEGKDARRTRLMGALAVELREAGNHLTGRAFLDAVKAEVDKTLGTPAKKRVDKVDAGGEETTSAGVDTSRAGKYEDLPPEAKRECEKDIKSGRIKIGKGMRHEDANSYRRQYAKLYFGQSTR